MDGATGIAVGLALNNNMGSTGGGGATLMGLFICLVIVCWIFQITLAVMNLFDPGLCMKEFEKKRQFMFAIIPVLPYLYWITLKIKDIGKDPWA